MCIKNKKSKELKKDKWLYSRGIFAKIKIER